MNRRDPVDDMKTLLYIVITMAVIYGISYFAFGILFYLLFPPVL